MKARLLATVALLATAGNTVPDPHANGHAPPYGPSHTSPAHDAHQPATLPLADPDSSIPITTARLPGFAPDLAERLLPRGSDMWASSAQKDVLGRLATAPVGQRQSARWDYAIAMMADNHVPEALGALDTMLTDDADMALVPAFRLARGAALARLHRNADALAMLTDPMLAPNSEACLWRMMSYAQTHRYETAIAEVRCALPAINGRKRSDAAPFIRAASLAALRTGRRKTALRWLALLPDGDHGANLLRGQALIGEGDVRAGRLRLDRVRANGSTEERMEAELALVEALSARGQMPAAEAQKRAERILFLWRGGEIEERALNLAYQLAEKRKDDVAILRLGGLLLRYGDTQGRGTQILKASQERLFAILQPDSGLSLADASGLFWDNRDLAPTGPDGDRLLELLAGRLSQAGLYERAADLLSYQMRARAKDIEKGPISEKVARFYILAGYPGRALMALRESDQPAYPPAILNARRRMAAIALYRLGKTDQALAMLADMPDMGALRGELLWRRRDWRGLVAKLGTPAKKAGLSEVDQALVLRHAVALAMTGQESALAGLRAHYGDAFARLPSAAAFELLTGPVEAMTSDSIARAMAAIPSVAVAGDAEALLDAPRQKDDATPPTVALAERPATPKPVETAAAEKPVKAKPPKGKPVEAKEKPAKAHAEKPAEAAHGKASTGAEPHK